MKKDSIIDLLHDEMYDAECSIDDLEDQLSVLDGELEFVRGRMSMASALLRRMEDDK